MIALAIISVCTHHAQKSSASLTGSHTNKQSRIYGVSMGRTAEPAIKMLTEHLGRAVKQKLPINTIINTNGYTD